MLCKIGEEFEHRHWRQLSPGVDVNVSGLYALDVRVNVIHRRVLAYNNFSLFFSGRSFHLTIATGKTARYWSTGLSIPVKYEVSYCPKHSDGESGGRKTDLENSKLVNWDLLIETMDNCPSCKIFPNFEFEIIALDHRLFIRNPYSQKILSTSFPPLSSESVPRKTPAWCSSLWLWDYRTFVSLVCSIFCLTDQSSSWSFTKVIMEETFASTRTLSASSRAKRWSAWDAQESCKLNCSLCMYTSDWGTYWAPHLAWAGTKIIMSFMKDDDGNELSTNRKTNETRLEEVPMLTNLSPKKKSGSTTFMLWMQGTKQTCQCQIQHCQGLKFMSSLAS